MVLLIIIPFLNGYFIGNINPTSSDKPEWNWVFHPVSPRSSGVLGVCDDHGLGGCAGHCCFAAMIWWAPWVKLSEIQVESGWHLGINWYILYKHKWSSLQRGIMRIWLILEFSLFPIFPISSNYRVTSCLWLGGLSGYAPRHSQAVWTPNVDFRIGGFLNFPNVDWLTRACLWMRISDSLPLSLSLDWSNWDSGWASRSYHRRSPFSKLQTF